MTRVERLCHRLAALGETPFMARYRRARRAMHGWMFATGTRAVELFNAAMLLTWAAALLDDRLLALSVYIGASMLTHPWANELLAFTFAVAAGFGLAGALRKDKGADKLRAWGLQAGAALWLGVSLNFLASYPPINTGVGTYLLLAFLTWSAGCYLRDD